MRWDHLRLTDDTGPALPLLRRRAVARTFDTPGFHGVTFYEIHARTIINTVPRASRLPFTHTINPYRGCTHACVYCFARNSHTYLDLDPGADFDSKIIVKVNAAELARRELTHPRWHGAPIALGTNVDCYQRAEGRYRLMPGILAALRDTANPFSILTKGTLILRDLPLLAEAAERTTVSVAVSVGFIDHDLWRQAEPGTPSPTARLQVCAALGDAGIGCSVLMGPVLPYLTDSPRRLENAVRQIADAGATSVTAIPLHLRPGAREWYMAWLQRHHPRLVEPYRRLYARGAYAPKAYRDRITRQVADLAARYGIGRHARHRPAPPPPPPGPQQLSLLG
ncbi:Rv2578c family radical SAM protein [Thermomonospora cellulosilytica]|uniref:DNA repair photolyase n=1 Tax=Thermomonospora cellulosilytica TaxID=1411118 RepID=A0A7W3N198_9ACTN|nr:Rv2578c family radical SAM protein [Thermomonospora cellulosilytica]MBA9005675.1 DNA repair photolyase [Thermomonospora cellulosilytica]